jgi:DNA-binding MarR family transcriptional regulator
VTDKPTSQRGELSTPQQFRAVRSLVRRAILAVLICRGPSTTREMAEALGRTPQGLYRHLQILERAKLIVQDGTKGTGRDQQAVYRVVHRALLTPDRKLTRPERSALVDIAASEFRTALRVYEAVANDPQARITGPDRQAARMSQVMWLTPAERKRLDRALHALLDAYLPDQSQYHMNRANARPYALVMTYFPWALQQESSLPSPREPDAENGGKRRKR